MNVRSQHEGTKGTENVKAAIVVLMASYYSRSYVVSIQPTHFEIGHLVELQIAVAAVPVAKGAFKIINRLRSICLLDRIAVTVRTRLSRCSRH